MHSSARITTRSLCLDTPKISKSSPFLKMDLSSLSKCELSFRSNIELPKEPFSVANNPDKDGSFAVLMKPSTIIRVEGYAVVGETSIASVVEKDDITSITIGGSSLILGTKA